mgnify:CR=1 FL=1
MKIINKFLWYSNKLVKFFFFKALLNGVPLSDKKLNADDFEEGVLSEIMTQTPQLQKAVFKEEFIDTDSAIDFLMSRPNVMPR